MIRTMHIIRSADSAPGGADFVPLYIADVGATKRFEMVDIAWLARQFDGGQVDGVVDESQRDGILGGEVAAERAGRDVGDRGDLVDGRALESLPLAKFDGGIDQGGAGALFLAFAQTEGWLLPDFSHAGHANPPRHELT